jgi:predicted dinucleotide-binding enzyme
VQVGIIGAGSLGRAIARRLLVRGHNILFGGRESAEEAAVQLNARHGSNADAAQFGPVTALAVPYAAVPRALEEAGSLEGVILWSCVNALKPDLTGLAVGFDTSAAEEVAKLAPLARVIAAIPPFAEALDNGDLFYDCGLNPSVFVCGNDASAKPLVERLISELGAHPVDAGPLRTARLVEPAMMLLVNIAYSGVPRDVGLRFLERTH